MKNHCTTLLLLLSLSCSPSPDSTPAPSVGTVDGQGGVFVTTKQLIRPAGTTLEFAGRPVDLALSADSAYLYAKTDRGIVVIHADSFAIRQELLFESDGGSMYGLAIGSNRKLYVTSRGNRLREAAIADDGKLKWMRPIELKGTGGKGNSYPCGVALGADAKMAFVCLSMNNTLAVVDLEIGKTIEEIAVGVAPYGVLLSKDQTLAYITNWGGRRPKEGERSAKSAGTDTLVDERGVGSSGTVSVVDLNTHKELAQIPVGLHPSDLKLGADGSKLFVANANSDTVSVIDTAARKVVETILVRPDATLPFGSATNALALHGNNLFVANGGNNAIAQVRLTDNAHPSNVEGFIPAGWYPGAVVSDGHNLFVANVKGIGSRRAKPQQEGWGVRSFQGTVNKVALPTADQLTRYTEQVRADARVPQTLAAWEKSQAGVKPTPVPRHIGEPSVFEHVVYVIKENRTYDQVLGDIGKGNSEPKLCVFGQNVAPNLHALANDFVLLDNFYCNGVVSADGHGWVTQGLAVDYLEKSFGGFVRSYPYRGEDPLAMASTGFIWDNVLLHGKSFRNYGEMSGTETEPKSATFADVFADRQNGTNMVKFKQTVANESLRRYSCPDYPGWDLKVPDAVRIDVFMKEFELAKSKKDWPNFLTVYLPSDHTRGTAENAPTPAAMVADNDLAVGKLVDAISHSPFWPTTCIFVIEDDPQNGFDHVDGHRSVCWVISPYTKRGAIVSDFYNQTAVLHTMELMLGLPPMNQMDAMAPVMSACFNETADLRPFTALKNNIPLNQMNQKKTKLAGKALQLAQASEHLDFDGPDKANEDVLNRIIWHTQRGLDTPYPAEYAGAHGKGLKALKLKAVDDDDDD